ncbi:MAG: uracil phosphoribosyltransferase [Prevotellaceae bacterium]|jgi:uracil phosphoribosyltransferase|nr:uracil phosphoribosyltransferase [Prevotellaceae bacterium]
MPFTNKTPSSNQTASLQGNLHVLSKTPSVFNCFIAEMRDSVIQKDSMRFRRNMERAGEIFAYEISKTLSFSIQDITTPLGISSIAVPTNNIVLATILRAGLPLHQGFLNYFDKAENAFIAAYRKYGKDYKFTIQLEYLTAPAITGKILILMDPMLATGESMHLTYCALMEKGQPLHTHVVSPIASKYGVEYIHKNLSQKDITLWVGAIDEELTTKAYIVPGLGDAGDLAYGEKL